VPPNDPQALADALILLAGNSALRHRMGVAGHRLVIDKFSNEKILAAIEKAYADLLKQICR
jgi:glycosyltransferase involved in cell wall biosynthesis